MKKKNLSRPFYFQFVKTEKIYFHLQKANLTQKEKEEILKLIEETLHTKALDAILDRLPKEKHEEFLEKFWKKPDDLQLLSYLKEAIEDIDRHLEKVFRELEKEISEDISKSLTSI